jgi:hypothetical protein
VSRSKKNATVRSPLGGRLVWPSPDATLRSLCPRRFGTGWGFGDLRSLLARLEPPRLAAKTELLKEISGETR